MNKLRALWKANWSIKARLYFGWIIVAVACGFGGTARANLIGISTDRDSLYAIDASTGAATFIAWAGGNYAGIGLSALDTRLFATDRFFHIGEPWDVRTMEVNPITGSAIPITGNQDGSLNWHGLASDNSAALLYTVALDQGNILKSISSTGTIVTIGTGTGIDGRGMAFDDNTGTLYATNSGDHSLYTIDITTGIASLTGALGFNAAFVGLAFDEANGILYANAVPADSGIRNGSLYNIDVMTGAATHIGTNGVNFIDGLAWMPDVFVPEPTTLLLLGLGLAGLGFTRRRLH